MILSRKDFSIEGFTLLELVVAISLVSLLISFSVPSLLKYQRSQDSKSLTSHIKSDLHKIYAMSRRFSAFVTYISPFLVLIIFSLLQSLISFPQSRGRLAELPPVH